MADDTTDRYTILCGDPARGNDRFAFVGASLHHTEKLERHFWRINLKFARQYQKTTFEGVAADMSPIIRKVRPDFIGLESNNEGKQALAAFHQQGHTQTKSIFTTGTMTAANRKKKWESMDKPYTINWLRRCAAADGPENAPAFIAAPLKPSPQMRVLLEQITMIKQYRTHTGEFSYKAISSRHDDLFMAFLLCCHVARHVIGTRDPLNMERWEEPLH